MIFSWLMFRFSSPRDTNDIMSECCCLISSISTILDLVYRNELNTKMGGMVAKKKMLSMMNPMKNTQIHLEFLIATNWLSGYASYVDRMYIMNIVLSSYR